MSVESLIESEVSPVPTWEPPMPPTDLIFDDGEPLETYRHRLAMNLLLGSLNHAWAERNDFFAGGNMFLYYSSEQVRNRDFRGPDFFAVLEIDGTYERQGWVVWQEGGRYPDIILELLSTSTAAIDRGPKKRLYEQVFRTPDYFIFDPFNPNSLQGWHLDADQRYQPLVPNERGWLWSQTLGLWLGTWEGTIERNVATWVRFYDQAGVLVPLPEETAAQNVAQAHQRLEQERQRAEQESQRAEQESQRAEQESQRAEQESQRAEQESQRAEQESQRAEQERQLREDLLRKLRERGIDPDSF